VVAVSSFAHPEQVMQRWLAEYRIPFWPLGWMVNRYIERVIGHRFDDIAPVATIARIEAPVLLVHGQQDDVVPLACALRLQASAPRATLLEVPGRHDGFDDAEALYKQVSTWLERVERA
jgi:pimeloyl-ACP methyl ester carboxylesterase